MYWKDPYQQEFVGRATKVEGNRVWLDQTIFYPESGGQAGDAGYLGTERVTDTQFDEEKNIVHILENTASVKVGEEVSGRIDWERRYKIMRVHSASHIMEYFLFQVFGKLKLVGSHLNEKHDSSSYEYEGSLSKDELQKAQDLANEFIAQSHVIETYPDEKKLYYRWWRCGEIVMPCGGTHVKNTAEIGKIKLKRKTGGQGREQVITTVD
jgi:alanyl-tRNA synthetase